MRTNFALFLLCQQVVVHSFAPPPAGTTRTTTTTHRASLFASRSEQSEFTVGVIASDQVILPGETAMLFTEEDELVHDAVKDHYGVLAVGVVPEMYADQDETRYYNTATDEEEFDDDYAESVLEAASLCEIKEVRDTDITEDGGIAITIKCVGRVRLADAKQSWPYLKFSCSKLIEDVGDVTRAKMVAENIELLLKQLSQKERLLGFIDDDEDLEEQYKKAHEKAMKSALTTENNQLQLIKDLTATSWACFSCMEDSTLEHYRIKALDWDNMCERLLLAQYMLREKQLRLQGSGMLEEPSSILRQDSTCLIAGEGFQ